ncbi:MAG: hypothetical protein HRU19_23445 [Pseudobacteriovorax sp.]|nr:hypothetical protein [Pseudobacteriovorax sp.]
MLETLGSFPGQNLEAAWKEERSQISNRLRPFFVVGAVVIFAWIGIDYYLFGDNKYFGWWVASRIISGLVPFTLPYFFEKSCLIRENGLQISAYGSFLAVSLLLPTLNQ